MNGCNFPAILANCSLETKLVSVLLTNKALSRHNTLVCKWVDMALLCYIQRSGVALGVDTKMFDDIGNIQHIPISAVIIG